MPVDATNLSGVSRRSFLRFAAAASAVTAVPILTEAHLALAQRRKFTYQAPPHDAVRIDANENPLGPCSGACASISSLIPEGGRYDYDLTEKFVSTFCDCRGPEDRNTCSPMPGRASRCITPCWPLHQKRSLT